MARVFLIENPVVNVEKAKRFGDLVILLDDEPKVSAINTDYYAGLAIEALEHKEFNPKEDYLCLVGSMSSVAVALAAMIRRFGGIKCLIFHAGRGEYVLRTLGRWKYPEKWRNNEPEVEVEADEQSE